MKTHAILLTQVMKMLPGSYYSKNHPSPLSFALGMSRVVIVAITADAAKLVTREVMISSIPVWIQATVKTSPVTMVINAALP